MKTKVLRIFAIIVLINFFACGTSKDGTKTETDDFFLESVEELFYSTWSMFA